MTSAPTLRQRMAASRWWGPLMLAVAVLISVTGGAIFWFASETHAWSIFGDLAIYMEATKRVLASQSWYLDRQLVGPYILEHGDVLYPPVTAWFFLPWLLLPAWTFLVTPLVIIVWSIIYWRPRPWTWPLLALGVVFPTSLLFVVFANPTLWIAAFIALGLRFDWPGVLVLLKPSVAPFALTGIRNRRWWFGLGVLVVLSIPLVEPTLLYPQVILDSSGSITYSLTNLPLLLVPIFAWLGRRTPRLSGGQPTLREPGPRTEVP